MNIILTILRSLINDNDSTYFSNDDLKRLILTAAINVSMEITFDTDYILDVINLTIDPDPTDNNYCFFVAYKSAIILMQTELRKYSIRNIKIVDGPSTIDLTGVFKSIKDTLDSLLSQYEKMKMNYLMTGGPNGGGIGYAVITPTTVNYSYMTGRFS